MNAVTKEAGSQTGDRVACKVPVLAQTSPKNRCDCEYPPVCFAKCGCLYGLQKGTYEEQGLENRGYKQVSVVHVRLLSRTDL